MTNYIYRWTFLLTVLFVSCTLPKQEKLKINPVTHSVTLGGYFTCDTTDYIFIKSSLTNNSEDSLFCVTMSCSGESAYKIESNYLSKEANWCFSNFPMLIKVAPHKSFDYFLRLIQTQKNKNLWDINFRLGYNLVLRDTTKELSSQAEQIADMKNIIWSDTVHLKDFWMRYGTY